MPLTCTVKTKSYSSSCSCCHHMLKFPPTSNCSNGDIFSHPFKSFIICATLFVLKRGMEMERRGLSEATSQGNFSVKCPFPPSPPSASSIPLFCRLLSAVWALGPIIIRQSPWSNILRFPGEGLWAITLFSGEKRALRRRSASLLPMQCTLSSYLYGSNFGAWLEFQCPLWVL